MPDFFPPLPLDAWRATKDTLHLYLQVVGKVRLARMPKRNHWWHVPLYLSARGLTTRPIPDGDRVFEIAFDFLDHRLGVQCSDGPARHFALEDGLTVAAFYAQLTQALADVGVEARIEQPEPFDHPTSTTPFADDTAHHHYDAAYVHRFWRILTQIDPVFRRFRGRFLGKDTPIHLFWHSFDLAYTRFSGESAPPMPAEAGRVEREAYSHEVVSFGFWAGDDDVGAPAFYSYTYPEPEGLTEAPLAPEAAFWQTQDSGSLALLMYDDVRTADDPRADLLAFLDSAYQAGATRAGWDVERLAHAPA
jgi:hypothetical protein